jgi:hypothetical protein
LYTTFCGIGRSKTGKDDCLPAVSEIFGEAFGVTGELEAHPDKSITIRKKKTINPRYSDNLIEKPSLAR